MNSIHVREATKFCFERYCCKFQKYLTDSELALCDEGINDETMYRIIKPMCKQIVGYEFRY